MLLLLTLMLGCIGDEGEKGAPADDTDSYSIVVDTCPALINVGGAAVLEVYACCEADPVCTPTPYTIAGTILTVECGEGCYASVALLDVVGG